MNYSASISAALPDQNQSALAGLRTSILGAMGSNVSVFALSMVTSVILNRSLGPSGKGIYALLMTSSQLISLAASLGLPKAITYYLAQPQIERRKCFHTIVTLTLLTLGVSAAVILAVRGWAPVGVGQHVLQSHFWQLLLLTLTAVLGACGTGALRGLKLFKQMNLSGPLMNGALLFLTCGLLLANCLTVEFALLSRIECSLLVIGCIIWQLRKQGFGFSPKLDKTIAGGLFSYGLGYFGYVIFQNLNYRFDVLLVSAFTDAAHTGWYSTATGLSEILWFIPTSIGTILMPVVAGAGKQSGDQITAKVCRIGMMFLVFGVLAVVCGSRVLVKTLYGEAFLPTVPAIYALAIGIISNGLYTVLGTHLASRRMLGTLMAITALGFAVNLLLNLLWIPRWGIVGAGLSSSVSYSVTGLLVARSFSKSTGIAWREFLLVRRDEMVALFDRGIQMLGRTRR